MASPDDPPRTTRSSLPETPPLSWPPPGLEPIQGKIWRVIALSWIGSLILVFPLLWSLAVEQPAWSFGPFGANWEIGVGLTAAGLVVLLVAFMSLFTLLRRAGDAARDGYGTLTILEVVSDLRRDTGFLIQGKRHFSHFPPDERGKLVRARLKGAGYLLAAGLWLSGGFAVSVLMAARGFLTESGLWLATLGPAVILLALGLAVLGSQAVKVDSARRRWIHEAGGQEKVAGERESWQERRDQVVDDVVLGSGNRGRPRSFRRGSVAAVVLFLVILVPAGTIAVSSAIGPILADTAIPTFLSVQEMAGTAEVLRPYALAADPAIEPLAAGEALQNLVFVGASRPEPMERSPRTRYEDPWFPEADRFPDPFAEAVAADLMATPLTERPEGERAALRQAAGHPAQSEFGLLARAPMVDIISARWALPFPDSATAFNLPWPRFTALRTAALAGVSSAVVALEEGRTDDAETTLRQVVSVGFQLVDEGPTLIDNLMGVVVVNMGGDALEAFYRRTGRSEEAERIRWARESAAAAASIARVGIQEMDVHTLLLGIPPLVERSDALRGLRWEYLATFNMLAPCINLHKMVFGPDDSYHRWMQTARDRLVRVPGEAAFFDLARSGGFGNTEGQPRGRLALLLTLTLGSETQPGSCASIIASLENAGSL